MPTRILPAVGDADAVRSLTTLLSQLPDAEPVAPVVDSTQLVDTLARLAAESVDELPEVVVVHERIGPVPALELVREVALRFPAVGVILVTSDASPGLFQAEANKFEINPVGGVDLEALVKEVYRTPPEVAKKAAAAVQ